MQQLVRELTGWACGHVTVAGQGITASCGAGCIMQPLYARYWINSPEA